MLQVAATARAAAQAVEGTARPEVAVAVVVVFVAAAAVVVVAAAAAAAAVVLVVDAERLVCLSAAVAAQGEMPLAA